MPWTAPPRILSEHILPLDEPLACLLAAGAIDSPAAVATRAARALLDVLDEAGGQRRWPAWLAAHQVPAAERLVAIVTRHGGAVLADAVGLGKSYVALAVALTLGEPFTLVVPAVLAQQWRALLAQHASGAPILTHESLSAPSHRPLPPATARSRLYIVDEAHRFRNPETRRYRALARAVVGMRVLLVTATPVHNRVGDLCHLLRLFLRDDCLTALGVPSLRRAARGQELDPTAIRAAAARVSVARSRERVRIAYPAGGVPLSFPALSASHSLRVGPAAPAVLEDLVAGIHRLDAGGPAAALFRLLLLSRLSSSVPAFRESLARYDAFLDLCAAAAAEGRALGRRDFRRLFPTDHDELQLALFPLLLPAGGVPARLDRAAVLRLRALASPQSDPKAEALAQLLDERNAKTIVFVNARATVHHLLGQLRGRRVGAVAGARGWFGRTPAPRDEVLRAFAPGAQRAHAPARALETDVLVATDLVSEGLNLQDASRVIHYDLPWSPARLAQRVGRIDRAASPHQRIETVTFFPPPPLADAVALERRLAAKQRAQADAGAGPHGLDWCDRLQRMAAIPGACPAATPGSCAAVAGGEAAVVIVVRLGGTTEAVVVTEAGAVADPARAAVLLERAATADAAPLDRGSLEQALRQAVPLVRRRLVALEEARWRAADRDRMSRRLIPWVLAAARRAAARGRKADLCRLDALVSRLAVGATAGEELLLEDLLARRSPVSVRDVLAWHERLPPVEEAADAPRVELVAAMVLG